jgi:ATP diphosphatase
MDEFGDLLFSLVNVGRLLGLNAEEAIRSANSKFERRFKFIEKSLSESGKSVTDSDLTEMDQLWNEAKSKGL